MRDLRPFQCDSQVEWEVGQPTQSEGLDAILVFGGDGTAHRHLAALVKLRLPVLVVPAGSGNDFARALGLLSVSDSVGAWRKFVGGAGNVRVVDLGVITPLAVTASYQGTPSAVPLEIPPGSRLQPLSSPGNDSRPDTRYNSPGPSENSRSIYFSCVAGVGLDGEIARRANSLPRWLRAHGGYALCLPAALARFRPFDLKLSVSQGEPSEFCLRTQQPVVAAVFANTPVYGGGMKLVDQLADFQSAVDDTAKAVGIHGEPVLVRPEKDRKTLSDLLFGDVSEWIPTREKLMDQHVGFYYMWK